MGKGFWTILVAVLIAVVVGDILADQIRKRIGA